jgi:hypothetical protein
MNVSLLGARANRLSSTLFGKEVRRSFHPSLENLEGRWTPAVMNLPIDVTDVRVNDAGQLEAVVELAGQAAEIVPIAVTTEAPPAGEDCPILNLELGPIHLDLLGLNVDTSAICLDVTATDDEGLLGGLLCDLAGGGLNLAGILDQLDDVTGQVDQFLGSLERLLDNVLGRAMTVTDVLGEPLVEGSPAAVDEGLCDILGLSLGPVDLQVPLLGVNVALDDCNDGPVTVDVTADPEGGLLGSLLCGLAGGIDVGDLNPNQLVRRIDRLVDRLGVLADRLDALPNINRAINAQIARLERVADRADDLRDIDRILSDVNRLVGTLDRRLARIAA